jgi:hypothetical protein
MTLMIKNFLNARASINKSLGIFSNYLQNLAKTVAKLLETVSALKYFIILELISIIIFLYSTNKIGFGSRFFFEFN